MFGNRVCDVGVEPIIARVVSTHQALKLGELAHHASGEVGLCKFGRDLCFLRKALHIPQLVMPGPDPGIHGLSRRAALDCRGRPGNDIEG